LFKFLYVFIVTPVSVISSSTVIGLMLLIWSLCRRLQAH